MAETQSLVVVIRLCFKFSLPTPDGILMLRLERELEPELRPMHFCIPAFSFSSGLQCNPRCVKLELCMQHNFAPGRPRIRMNVRRVNIPTSSHENVNMKECTIQLWSYHSPCAAHLAETGQEHTTDSLAMWNNKA